MRSLLLLGLLVAVCGWNFPTSIVSTFHRIESHHSLHTPLDKSQVYWNFGGSAVLTKNFIRLTPSTQDRRGWIWNEYPLESDNWEVEFKAEVFSKPHFGGDGFGFWVLAGDEDPAFSNDPEALSGSVFGMKDNYQGFGVVFDVYDNDNRRNNPNVFVIKNFEKNVKTKYNHDNDYEDDMYTVKPAAIWGVEDAQRSKYTAHRCVADLRNTGKVTKVLVKFLHKVLHVYIDTQEGSNYKFCLAVQFDKVFTDHHIAFSAATGQVADNMDILEVTTRYLSDSDKDTDDSKMAHLGQKSSTHRFSGLFWTLITLAGLGLTLYAGYELASFRQMMGSHIDAVRVCQQFNKYIMPHYLSHGALFVLLLLFGTWWSVFLNLPIVAYRAYLYAGKAHLFSPNAVGAGAKVHTGFSGFQLTNTQRQIATLALYVVLQLYYFNILVG